MTNVQVGCILLQYRLSPIGGSSDQEKTVEALLVFLVLQIQKLDKTCVILLKKSLLNI